MLRGGRPSNIEIPCIFSWRLNYNKSPIGESRDESSSSL